MTPSSLLLGLVLAATSTGGTIAKVVFPAPESPQDTRHRDLIELVTTALDRTVAEFGPYSIEPSRVVMNEVRAQAELKRGRLIDIAWFGTTREREKDLLPVRIPMRKGLLGYRIALIDRSEQARIDEVRTLSDLRQMRIGQGVGWGDVAVYEANAIPVTTAEYESLFEMLPAGRFELFPRGLSEVFEEQESRVGKLPTLAVEQGLILYYPWPFYCFFNRNDTALATRIETGLRRMIRDGTFDRIFLKYHGTSIQKAGLGRRRQLTLANPLLPPETPLDDPSLWLNPSLSRRP